MTATEPASLDAILANAIPVEAEPFDLGDALDLIETYDDRLSNDYDRSAMLTARDQIARHVNAERVRTEDARRWVDRLQGECAAKDQRIREALGFLGDALVWATDDNTRDCVQEAIAALKGDES